jgi:hypothetical protein
MSAKSKAAGGTAIAAALLDWEALISTVSEPPPGEQVLGATAYWMMPKPVAGWPRFWAAVCVPHTVVVAKGAPVMRPICVATGTLAVLVNGICQACKLPLPSGAR